MTATLSAPSSTNCFVRIRRAPTIEPPADDDRHRDDHPVCTGQLALFTSIQSARIGAGLAVLAAGPVAQVGGSARPAGAVDVSGSPVAGAGWRPPDAPGAPASKASKASKAQSTKNAAGATGPAGATPLAAQVAAGRFVSACVEVLNGFRPAAHLRALTTPFDYSAVAKQLTRRGPTRAPGGTRVGLHRVCVFEQRAGVAEAVAVLSHGDVAWAIALRFEHRRGTWLCNLLEVV